MEDDRTQYCDTNAGEQQRRDYPAFDRVMHTSELQSRTLGLVLADIVERRRFVALQERDVSYLE